MRKRIIVLLVILLAVIAVAAAAVHGGKAYDSAIIASQEDMEALYAALGGEISEEHLSEWWEITPKAVSDTTDWRIFKLQNQYSYLLVEGELYPLCSMWGGWGVTSAVPWDYDGNGVMDLLYTYSWGSGIHRSHVAVFDATAKLTCELQVVYAEYDEDAVVLPPEQDAPEAFPVYLASPTYGADLPMRFLLKEEIGVVHIQDGIPRCDYTTADFSDAATIDAADLSLGFPVDNTSPLSDYPAVSITELDAVFGDYRGEAVLHRTSTEEWPRLEAAHAALPIPALRKAGDYTYYAVYPVQEGGRYLAFFSAYDADAILTHAVWLQELPSASACAQIVPDVSTALDVAEQFPGTEFFESLQYAAYSFTLLDDGTYLEVLYRYDIESDTYIVRDAFIVPAETARHFACMGRVMSADLP